MRIRHLLPILLPVLLLFGSGCRAGSLPEVMDQHLSVTLHPATHLVQGEGTATVRSGGADTIAFTVDPRATVSSVEIGGTPVPVRFAAGTVTVPLPRGDAPHPVTIRYRAVFNDPLPPASAGTEDPTYGISGVVAPEGIFLGSDRAWYPHPPLPPQRRTLTVTTPPEWEAVTAGRRVGRERTWEFTRSRWEELHPVAPLSLSAGRYAVTEATADGMPLFTFLGPHNAHLATGYLKASRQYLDQYEDLLGPYPFEKFAVVENFFPTGYGFPSYTLIGGTVLRLPFILDTSLPHEIVHNWWGNGVGVDFREGNWSEGLVTYLAEHLLEERKSPALATEYRYRILADFAALVSSATDFPLARFTGRSDPASRTVGYGKGAMLFHMIRSRIGDDAFFETLRRMCRERMYGTAAWRDFGTAFSRAAGEDLGPMMQQWLQRTGAPQLALADVAVTGEGGKWRVSGRVVQQEPYWQVRVPVVVEQGGSVLKQEIALSGAEARFSLPLQEPHGRLLLDPEVDLFRLLPHAEIPPAVNSIKGSRNLLVVTTRGCAAGSDTLRLLLQSLGHAGAEMVTEQELEPAAASGRDLLVCGVPHKELLPPLPRELALLPGGFRVGQESFDGSDATLFAVVRRPGTERVAALFLPGSDAAAAASVRKIGHYGKYGYLAFRGADNRAKGLARGATTGAAVDF